MNLTDAHISSLLAQRSITDQWPWSTNDESTSDRHIKDIIAEVRRTVRLLDKTEYGHYGSGYSSYVDCWLYRKNEEFRFAPGDCYWGLVILFSRLSKCYVLSEGQKTWDSKGKGTSYLPSFDFIDQVDYPATRGIVEDVCDVLEKRGLMRLNVNQLSELLPEEIQVPTVLSDPPWHLFDAIFYWED